MNNTKLNNTQHDFAVDTELIKELTEAFGVSGCEFEVRELILSQISDCCDRICTDKIGNLIAVKKSKEPDSKSVMLVANMDEPGFIISRFKEGGGAFLDFSAVGKIRPHTVISEAVSVGEEKLNGIISLKAVHLTTKEERDKPVKLSDLFIDIGAADKDSAESRVKPGDYAAFRSNFVSLGTNALCNKAAASRACCAVLIELLKREHDCNLVCVFSVQKEVGMRGSKIDISEYTDIKPDTCVVLDAAENDELKLGDGIVTPNIINETIADKRIFDILKSSCIYRTNQCAAKTVDSDIRSVSSSYGGTLCAEIDIPAKNLGTSAVTVDRRDINDAGAAIQNFINQFSHIKV